MEQVRTGSAAGGGADRRYVGAVRGTGGASGRGWRVRRIGGGRGCRGNGRLRPYARAATRRPARPHPARDPAPPLCEQAFGGPDEPGYCGVARGQFCPGRVPGQGRQLRGSRLSRGCAGLPRSRRAGTLRPWPRCACAASAPRGRGARPRSSAAPRTWTRPCPACRRQARRTCVRADVRSGAASPAAPARAAFPPVRLPSPAAPLPGLAPYYAEAARDGCGPAAGFGRPAGDHSLGRGRATFRIPVKRVLYAFSAPAPYRAVKRRPEIRLFPPGSPLAHVWRPSRVSFTGRSTAIRRITPCRPGLKRGPYAKINQLCDCRLRILALGRPQAAGRKFRVRQYH